MYNNLRLIGDVHGHLDVIRDAYDPDPGTLNVAVGDVGVGFVDQQKIIDLFSRPNLMMIRGNHDNPHLLPKTPGWIPDGMVDAEHGIMYVGGAYSIDKAWRTPGRDWWPEEEFTWEQSERLMEIYEKFRPEIMVTHDLPESAATYMCKRMGKEKFRLPSQVDKMLNTMFERHKPAFWYTGHWHVSWSAVYMTTRFRVLNINEVYDHVF